MIALILCKRISQNLPIIKSFFIIELYSFSCEWDGDNIVVLNEFYIAPPYDRVQYVRPNVGGDNSGIERVIKVVSIYIYVYNLVVIISKFKNKNLLI